VAQVRTVTPGYTVIHPNRDKDSCKVVRLVVVLLLIVSIVLMLLITIGGWSELQGLKPVNFIWCIVYAVIAVYIWRWSRGLLPIAAALGILLLIIAIIAGTGLAGTSWADREHVGFATAQSLFGGSGFSDSTLSFLTILLIPVELALIVFAMVGFAQGWNVEMEVPDEEARRRGSTPAARGPEPAPA
jgi:hypothetical protein